MQSPSSFRAHGRAANVLEPVLDSEFDIEEMLEQLASQKETAARAPFMAPAFLEEQISRMDEMRIRDTVLQEVEIAETNRFRVCNDSQELTAAMPAFRRSANATRSKIEALDVMRRSPLETPKERYKGLPAKRSEIREVIDYASLNDLLEEIQLKKMGITCLDSELLQENALLQQNKLLQEEEMASRFSTQLPKIARSAGQSLAETISGCVAVIKLLFFGASLGFTDYSNI